MGRACTVCRKPEAGEIARLLEEGRSARSLALEFGVSKTALLRHINGHVIGPVDGVDAVVNPRSTSTNVDSAGLHGHDANPLDELVDTLRPQALAGNPAIVHQYRLALAAQADAQHAAPPRRDLAAEPEWIGLRTAVLQALEPYPEARLALADALADA